jgi:hypothetical protein
MALRFTTVELDDAEMDGESSGVLESWDRPRAPRSQTGGKLTKIGLTTLQGLADLPAGRTRSAGEWLKHVECAESTFWDWLAKHVATDRVVKDDNDGYRLTPKGWSAILPAGVTGAEPSTSQLPAAA